MNVPYFIIINFLVFKLDNQKIDFQKTTFYRVYSFCNKGFAKKNHLDRHRLTHTRDKSKGLKQNRIANASSCVEGNESKHLNQAESKGRSTNSLEEPTKPTCQTMDTKAEANTTKENANIKQENSIDDGGNASRNITVNLAADQDEQALVSSAVQLSGGRLQCPICPRTLSHRKILRLHIRSHIGLNLLHCKICQKGFAKGSNLNRHMLLHCSIDRNEENRILQTATQKSGFYSCPYCAKTLIDRQTFRLHIRLHISQTLNRCEICNRGFDDDDELEKHMTCHGNEFPCGNGNCDQVFSTFGERKEHIRTEHVDQLEEIDRTERVKRSSATRKETNDSDADGDEDDEDKHIVEKSNCVNGR